LPILHFLEDAAPPCIKNEEMNPPGPVDPRTVTAYVFLGLFYKAIFKDLKKFNLMTNLAASALKFPANLKKFFKKPAENRRFFFHYPFYWIMIQPFGINC
jgi:hypothetical protein